MPPTSDALSPIPVGYNINRNNRRPIAVPVRFVTVAIGESPQAESPPVPQPAHAEDASEGLEDLFEDLAGFGQDEQRSLARELRLDAEADLLLDNKKLLADVRRAKAEAAEALRLALPCHHLYQALERQEVPEPLLNAIRREVRSAIVEESQRLYGALQQRVADEVADASRQRTEALSIALRGSASAKLKWVPKQPLTPTVSSQSSAPCVATSSTAVGAGVPTTSSHLKLKSNGTTSSQAGRRRGSRSSREFFENETAGSVALFGEELREAAGEARADLDQKIGLQLQNLREVLEAYAERWERAWKEVPQRNVRSGSGATPVKEVCPEAAPPPPDDVVPQPLQADDDALAQWEVGPSDPPESLKLATDPRGTPVQTPREIVHTPLDTARVAGDASSCSSQRLDETEQRLEELLRRLAETAEMEHRARQESELWLLGRVSEVKNELREVLARVVCLLEARSQVGLTEAIMTPNEVLEPIQRPEGLLRLLGGAVTSLAASAPPGTCSPGQKAAIPI